MINYTFTDRNGAAWARVTKKAAIKAWMDGETVALCPRNLRPFTMCACEYTTKRADRAQYHADDIGARNDFNAIIGSFTWYICTNTETGKYPAFYVKMEA